MLKQILTLTLLLINSFSHLYAQSHGRNTVQDDLIVYEQALLMVEAEIFQILRHDNRVDQRPYRELQRKVEQLANFGDDLRKKSMDAKIVEALAVGLQINRLYNHILSAYMHFFATNFDASKSILEELHQQTTGTNLAATFNLLSRILVNDLRRAAALPVYDNADLLALDKVRVGDFLRIQHWSNCRFENHTREYTFLRCLLRNTRDDLLIPVETETARRVLSVSGQGHVKPTLTVSTCRLHRLIKQKERFEVLCQAPLFVPKAEYKVLQVKRSTPPEHLPTNPERNEIQKPSQTAKTNPSAEKVQTTRKAATLYKGTAGFVEIPRNQRRNISTPQQEAPLNAAFESEREKSRYKFDLPETYREY